MLEARNISVKYGAREAVTNVSLEVVPGMMTAIVGANGAGKSSLLRVLNGTIEPSTGQILLDGSPLSSFARRTLGRRIAVVTQEALLAFPVSVLEYVLGGRYAWSTSGGWGWESERDLEIAFNVLRQTELEDFSDRLMNELSGGERQRAVLARALATEARILLLDEPTANLDLAHQTSMLQLVRKHCDQRKTAAVIVTHDINLTAEFADNVILLKSGRTIASGPPRDVLTEELLSEVLDIKVLVDAHPLSGAPRITPAYELRRQIGADTAP
ncbi:MAG TPA: ABC transporter ATP-binding protein [Pyrinomonadaceae bacterium]|nr:ABC transporter ATP-binding protein [Pyrinomonadaceae bacterium]